MNSDYRQQQEQDEEQQFIEMMKEEINKIRAGEFQEFVKSHEEHNGHLQCSKTPF